MSYRGNDQPGVMRYEYFNILKDLKGMNAKLNNGARVIDENNEQDDI